MKYEFDLKEIIFEISSERKPTNREIVEYDKFKAFEEKFCKKLSAQQKKNMKDCNMCGMFTKLKMKKL